MATLSSNCPQGFIVCLPLWLHIFILTCVSWVAMKYTIVSLWLKLFLAACNIASPSRHTVVRFLFNRPIFLELLHVRLVLISKLGNCCATGACKINVFNFQSFSRSNNSFMCTCVVHDDIHDLVTAYSVICPITLWIQNYVVLCNIQMVPLNWLFTAHILHCFLLSNSVQIYAKMADLWPKVWFSIWRPPPFWISRYINFAFVISYGIQFSVSVSNLVWIRSKIKWQSYDILHIFVRNRSKISAVASPMSQYGLIVVRVNGRNKLLWIQSGELRHHTATPS